MRALLLRDSCCEQLTGLPSSSPRRGATGVSLNLSSGPDFGRPCKYK
jgi:hypothetical protein